ncbi:glycoside hydrolase family 113 [Croceiramulus getboli]|nr:glycoside hydrolase [Flavobacteriaceae bacterium YJPT1-3]
MRSNRFLLLCILPLLLACGAQEYYPKIKGVSFVASRDSVTVRQIEPVVELGANYASVMPYGFIRGTTTPEIIYNTGRQWYGETPAGTKHYIATLQSKQIQIMMKPHLWIGRGVFTGEFAPETEADWQTFENSYRSYVLEYARLAEETQSEILCIATELEAFTQQRPKFWRELIKEIRTIYSGALTYAANWDEYQRVSFWEEMDFIGVDAYFPVCTLETPSVATARAGWQPWKQELAAFAKAKNKPILFTEYGYRSVNYAGKEPWKADRDMDKVNLEAQNNTLTALYEELWQEPWFAGGFLWKWFINHDEVGGQENAFFTPQNKPAQKIITRYYSAQ